MFRLHSGNWQGGMCNSLHQLQQNGILCDLILYLADDKQVKAHSCVMAAASPYLREFIVAKRNNAHLDMLNTEALEALIAYMYSGELEFTKLLLPHIVAAARLLQMDPLVEELARYQHCFLQSPHRIVSRDGCVRQPDIASSLYLPQAESPSKQQHSQEEADGEDDNDAASSASEDDEDEEEEEQEANNSHNTSLNNSLPDLSLPCDACGKTFKQKGALGMHYKSHLIETTNAKGEIDVVKCKACKVTLKKGLHFVVHLKQCAKRETFKQMLQRTKEQPFHCLLCDNNFEQRGAFGSHMKIHCVEIFDKDHVRVSLRCKLCQNVYSDKSDFMDHTETCPGRKDKQVRIRCKFANCSHAFQSRSSMLKHHAIHHGRKTSFLFRSSETLAKKSAVGLTSQDTQVKSAPAAKPGFKLKCSKCERTFKSQSEWMRHKLSKHSFFCGKCAKKFPTRCSFEVHLSTECPGQKTTTTNGPVKCKLCGKQFPQLYNLSKHMPSCIASNGGSKSEAVRLAKQVKCELCKKRLSCQAALVKHKDYCKVLRRQQLHKLKEKYSDTKEPAQGMATSKTNSVELDKDVTKTVTVNGTNSKLLVDAAGDKEQKAASNSEQRYLCGLCGVVIHDEQRFLQHKKVCSDTYNCEACGQRFKTQAKYIEHKDKNKECVSIDDIFIEEIHGCGACSEKFNTPIKVTIHANKCHKGADNQKAMALFRKDLRQCQVCKLKINKNSTPYYHHMWIAHGVRSNFHSAYYKCDLCHKRYIDPREFEVHETTHEENKMRHACTVCEQKFRRKQLLERHINEKHGGKLKQD